MKMLTLLVFISGNLLATEGEMGSFNSTHDFKNEIVSSIQEVQISDTLQKSIEFKECRDKYPFTSGQAADNSKIQAAIDCFNKKIEGRSTDDLKKLSSALGLQKFGLVSSKSQKSLTEYLSNNLYKSLTGVDPTTKNLETMVEQMKFGKMKMVDQKVFIDLYKTQIIKNSLYEVSRFCFENLRINDPTRSQNSFIEHWGNDLLKLNDSKDISDPPVTDIGSKGFGNFPDTANTDAIYKTMLEGMGADQPNKVKALEHFFMSCGAKIVPLCNVFREKVKSGGDTEDKTGANACLTEAKLQASRKAIADIGMIQKEFGGEDFSTKMLIAIKNYNPTNDTPNMDELTNYSSADILTGGQTENKKQQELQDDCIKNPNKSECEDFMRVGDTAEKAQHNLDLEMRFKKEVELKRISKLKDKEEDLKTYLQDNGYLDLLKKIENKEKVDIEKEIAAIYDAKRIATLDEMKEKIGSRQISEDDAKDATMKTNNIKVNAQQSKEERVRMAQVVLFNNIITGSLTLSKKGTGERLGANVNVIKKELAGLEKSKIDPKLFENIKVEDGKSNPTGSFDDAAGILDQILTATKLEEGKSK